MITLDRLLLSGADAHPTRRLYTFLDAQGAEIATLNWGELRQQAQGVAQALVHLGAQSQTVLLCTGPGPEQVVALFGAWLAGAWAVPVYPPMEKASTESLLTIARASQARILVAPQALCGHLAELLPQMHVIPIEQAKADITVQLPGSLAHDPAIILYTSGSTGDPKGATLRHHGFTANMATLAHNCHRNAQDIICTWLPHAHIAGLYTRLLAVFLGAQAVVLPATAFAGRPPLWLDVISRYHATFSAAPDFAYAITAQVISDAQVATLDLSSWNMAVSGGEPVRPSTVARFWQRLAPAGLRPEALHPYYGLTETLCTSVPQGHLPGQLSLSREGIVRGRKADPQDAADTVVLLSNGLPLGCEVRAVDPESRRFVAQDRIGELWTRGPGVIQDYFQDPLRSQESCMAMTASGEGPWFRTGDLGLIHQGEVYVTGRLKELIIVRGKNHYPIDIEATLLQAGASYGVQEAAAFVVRQIDDEEVLGVALELRDMSQVEQLTRALRRAVASRHGLQIYRLYLHPPQTLPRTATRKIQRTRCSQLATSGAWEAALSATAHQASVVALPADPLLSQLQGHALYSALLKRLSELLGLTGNQVDQPMSDLGLSSLSLAQLITDVRAATGAEPSLGSFFDGSCLREIVNQLVATMAHQAPPPPALNWRDPIRKIAWSLPNVLPPRRTRAGRILLTGATGFLGSWILRGLLESDQEVECLVRAPHDLAAWNRVVIALSQGPGWDERWKNRLFACAGDIALPRFGLENTAWHALADRSATILHNAADVNFVAPYAHLRAVNVDPVHALVALAIHGAETRTLHFVSTTAVYNSIFRREQRRILETDRLTSPEGLYSGYAQSKWVAETAFRAANVRGIPLGIHRPSLIVGDTQTGRAHSDDFLCRFIKGCLELGVYPDVDVELDLVAVDDVGRGIAAAAARPVQGSLEMCAWTATQTITIPKLFAVYQARGHQVAPEPLQRWLHRIRHALPIENALFPVHPFLLETPAQSQESILELLDGLPLHFDNRQAHAIRQAAGLTPMTLSTDLLDRMAAYLESSKIIPSYV